MLRRQTELPTRALGDALPLVQLVHRAKGKPASCLDRGAEGLSPWGIAPSRGQGERGQKRRG